MCGTGGDLEEQKEWLQDFLNEEFDRAGWNNGSIAWQDVAKRKSDLSNNDIFQVRPPSASSRTDSHPQASSTSPHDNRGVGVCVWFGAYVPVRAPGGADDAGECDAAFRCCGRC